MRELNAKRAIIADIFAEHVKKDPNRIAFYYEDRTYTFQQAEDLSNQVARFFDKVSKHDHSVVLAIAILFYYKGNTFKLL